MANAFYADQQDYVEKLNQLWNYFLTGPVQSVAGKTGVVTLAKNDVGLSNVDNTSDANKPVSTAQQAALDLKANLSGANFTGSISSTGNISSGLGTAGTSQNVIANGGASGTGAGGALIAQNNTSTIIAMGNKSGVVGGAYDATPYIYGSAAISTNVGINVGGTVNSTGLAATVSGNTVVVSADSLGAYIEAQNSKPFRIYTGGAQNVVVDTDGNVLAGSSTGSWHTFNKAVTESTTLLSIGSTSTSNNAALFYAVSDQSFNAAACAIGVGKNTTTSRSIDAAGTINASGTDYAEYYRKAIGCPDIAKGQIVGVDKDGKLTDKWDDAVSFLIKSTNPSYVGGDVWGNEDALGLKAPIDPIFQKPEYDGAPEPGPEPVSPDAVADDATEEEHQAYDDAQSAYETAHSAWDSARAAYATDQFAYAARVEVAKETFDTATYPTYLQQKATFDAALEAARQKVDRIAMCGQVPVNVMGAKPGDVILPDNGGTPWDLLADPEVPDWYKKVFRSVGVVQNILPDGRANVRVKVA